MDDVGDLDWAAEAFGGPPEATNLWIGNDDSVTSFHKVKIYLLHSACRQQGCGSFKMCITGCLDDTRAGLSTAGPL